jgi:hypothetical protein
MVQETVFSLFAAAAVGNKYNLSKMVLEWRKNDAPANG